MRQDSYKKQVEFDSFADEYITLHKTNIAITGDDLEYFSEYKINDLAGYVYRSKIPVYKILDFGSGIGNSLPFFKQYFPSCKICCAEVSSRSIEIAKKRYPGKEKYVLVKKNLPLPSNSHDLVFTACVFHHIPKKEHFHWLAELYRVTRPGGMVAIYEHNPLNPLTVRAVNNCPLDVNANLICGNTLRKRVVKSGWINTMLDYKLFFPSILSALRPLERHLEWLCLGAQYRIIARKPE